MEQIEKENIENNLSIGELFVEVWKFVNKATSNFNIQQNLEFYKNQNYFTNVDYINSFIYLLENNNILIIPFKIASVDINASNFSYDDYFLEKSIRSKLALDLNNISIYLHFISSLNKKDFIIEEYKSFCENIDKFGDFIALDFSLSNTSQRLMFKSKILEHFKDYKFKYDFYKSAQESIVKSNPEYHQLFNEKSKINNTLLRLNTKIKEITNKLSDIESNVINVDLQSEAYYDFENTKINCFDKLITKNIKNEKSSEEVFDSIPFNLPTNTQKIYRTKTSSSYQNAVNDLYTHLNAGSNSTKKITSNPFIINSFNEQPIPPYQDTIE
jgi:hypothetical protein